MKNKIPFILVCILVIAAVPLHCVFGQMQLFHPEIGKPVEDYTFTQLENIPGKKSVSISSYRGRWLFMDFWSSSCLANIGSLNELEKFRDAVGDKMDGFSGGRAYRSE